jgi:2-succinyl-5-enolpyruvyl-6-hydroxy-3-cyclohexene-1-carboxylate synthase
VNPSTALATVLVDELIACGVRDAVLCPGSRNAPLAMAMHAADAAGRLRLHVRIDERTAGFLAVGLSRSGGMPVPVATTSGTAVANLHPAVLEAHHGRVGLIVLSADRPPALRDVGANQVIDQSAVFAGSVLRLRHEFDVPTRVAGQNARWRSMIARAVAAAAGAAGRPGPVQLNLPLAEPLLPDSGADDAVAGVGQTDWPEPLTGRGGPWTAIPVSRDPTWSIAAPQPGDRCLFLADLTWPASDVAATGHPVISEAGGLAGSRVLAAGVHLLGDSEFLHAHRPDRLIVLGRPTLFRSVTALLGLPGLAVDVVDSTTGYADVTGSARAVAPTLASGTEPGPAEWVAAWLAADARVARAVSSVLGHHDVASSPVLARVLGSALAPGGTLVLGSSQTPRDIAMFTAARDGIRVLANRGVAGIDGTVSTAVGAALAADGPTVALMGDLAFLHDLTGLVIGPHEPRPDLTIVVANNDGGGIFGTLEPGEPAHAHAFERVFGTPVGAELAPIVEGLGAEHILAVTADELTESLREPVTGIRVIEVPVTRTDMRALLADVRGAVRDALAGD